MWPYLRPPSLCYRPYVFVICHWSYLGATLPLGTKIGLPLANLTRAKALVPRAFGTRCLVHKQYKTESLTKTKVTMNKWNSCQIWWNMVIKCWNAKQWKLDDDITLRHHTLITDPRSVTLKKRRKYKKLLQLNIYLTLRSSWSILNAQVLTGSLIGSTKAPPSGTTPWKDKKYNITFRQITTKEKI